MVQQRFVSWAAVGVAALMLVLTLLALGVTVVALTQEDVPGVLGTLVQFVVIAALCGSAFWVVGSQSVVTVTPTELRRPMRRPVPRKQIEAVQRIRRPFVRGLSFSGLLVGVGSSASGFDVLPMTTAWRSEVRLALLAEALDVPLLEARLA